MPHDGGGGSSGGDFSSGGGGGGGTRSGPVTKEDPLLSFRDTYFYGSERYVYYNKGKPVYFYSDKGPGYAARQLKSGKWTWLLYILCIAFGFIIFYTGLCHPHRLNVEDSEIIINDRLGVIENEAALRKSLRAFADKTGIIPAVMTLPNEDWVYSYDSLSDYAYKLYTDTWKDEGHWLIVYTQKRDANSQYDDWYWRNMVGDDTDPILNPLLRRFNRDLQKSLSRKNPRVGKALKDAFDAVTPRAMKIYVESWVTAASALIVEVVLIYFLITTVSDTRKLKLYASAARIPPNAVEMTCGCCGGTYISGTTRYCPHCKSMIVYSPTSGYRT